MWETQVAEAGRTADALLSEIANICRSRGLSEPVGLPNVVADSWKRCLADYNLLPDRVPRAEVLTHAQMRQVMQERENFLRIAEPEIEHLFLGLVEGGYLVSLASSGGAMLLFRCDYQQMGELAEYGVIPGSIWSEEQQGTNGVGTCLHLGKSVTIVGREHYGAATQSLTCLTAPVFGQNGVVESVINVTTARDGDSRMNRVVQSIVERSARRIENSYFARTHSCNVVLRILDSAPHSDLAEEGLLALDQNGRILDASSHVALLLNQPIASLRGLPAEDIFDRQAALSNFRPEVSMTIGYRGKVLQAVLTLPDIPTRRTHSYPIAGRTPSQRPSALTSQLLHFAKLDSASTRFRLDPILSQALDRACKLLSAGLPLVVSGESGTGKSGFAKAISHRCFDRNTTLAVLDCAVLGAHHDLASLLDEGTLGDPACLIIDRFDQLNEVHQADLLAHLDTETADRGVGLIVVSNLALEELVKRERLRPELLHRLKGGEVTLVPLRKTRHLEMTIRDLFLVECEAASRASIDLDEDVWLVLLNYHWPGNMRELRNALRHAVALSDGKQIRLDHLPDHIVEQIARKNLKARSQSQASKIEAALRHNGGNVSLTARYLGVSRATLYRKIQIEKTRREG